MEKYLDKLEKSVVKKDFWKKSKGELEAFSNAFPARGKMKFDLTRRGRNTRINRERERERVVSPVAHPLAVCATTVY